LRSAVFHFAFVETPAQPSLGVDGRRVAGRGFFFHQSGSRTDRRLSSDSGTVRKSVYARFAVQAIG